MGSNPVISAILNTKTSIMWLIIKYLPPIMTKYLIYFLLNFKSYNFILNFKLTNFNYIKFFRNYSWSLTNYVTLNVMKLNNNDKNGIIFNSQINSYLPNTTTILKYKYFLKKYKVFIYTKQNNINNYYNYTPDMNVLTTSDESTDVDDLFNDYGYDVNANLKNNQWLEKLVLPVFFQGLRYNTVTKLNLKYTKNLIDNMFTKQRNNLLHLKWNSILRLLTKTINNIKGKSITNNIFSNWDEFLDLENIQTDMQYTYIPRKYYYLRKYRLSKHTPIKVKKRLPKYWSNLYKINLRLYKMFYKRLQKNDLFVLQFKKDNIRRKKQKKLFIKLNHFKNNSYSRLKGWFYFKNLRRMIFCGNLRKKWQKPNRITSLRVLKKRFKKLIKKLRYITNQVKYVGNKKVIRKISYRFNLKIYTSLSIVNNYKKNNKKIRLTNVSGLENKISFKNIITNVVKSKLYYKDYYINNIYSDYSNLVRFSDDWKLNRFLNNKYVLTKNKCMTLSKLKIFTYYFNITSYKLFFNILLIYPFLLLNYSNKRLSLNQLFFKNSNFKLTNPHDLGDDRVVYNQSMYVEIGSFLEHLTQKSVNILIYKNSFSDISNVFKLILNVWIFRIKHFYRTFEYKFDLSLIIKLMYLSIKNKDIHLLMKLITDITPKITFKKQRKFFKFIIFMFRTYFSLLYPLYNIQGYQFEFRGKISVDGNARTRKMYAKIVRPSPSNYTYSTRYLYKTVNTYTGVLGLKVWIYYCH